MTASQDSRQVEKAPTKASITASTVALVGAILLALGKTVFGLDSSGTLTRSAVFLTFFMLIHCSGNLLIFAGDKGDRFNAYGYFLRSCPLILFIEGYLAIGTVLHAVSASWITIRDRKYTAIPIDKNGWNSAKWMRIRMTVTGLLILAFFVVHLLDFRFGTEYDAVKPASLKKNVWARIFGGSDEVGHVRDLYRLQVELFSSRWRVVFYCISTLAIARHLQFGWDKILLKLLAKEHRPNAKFVLNWGLDITSALFAATAIATHMGWV